jgi:hypothetical protein
VIDKHDDSYCSRCGGETCLDEDGGSSCGDLELFADVTTLTALDGPAGQSLFRFKRYGNPGDSMRFVTGLLPMLVETVEHLVAQHEVSCIVVLPFSRQSFMSGKMHPNLVIFDTLRARFGHAGSTLIGGNVSLACGMHSGKSRSLQRRRDFNRSSRMHSRSEGSGGGCSGAAVQAAWKLDNVRWLSAGSKPFIECIQGGGTVLFIDDVLSSGYTAARFAAIVDPESRCKWLLAAVARTVYRTATKGRL